MANCIPLPYAPSQHPARVIASSETERDEPPDAVKEPNTLTTEDTGYYMGSRYSFFPSEHGRACLTDIIAPTISYLGTSADWNRL